MTLNSHFGSFTHLKLLGIAAFLALGTQQASAAIVVSNINNSISGGIGVYRSDTAYVSLSNRFTTGTAMLDLNSIILAIGGSSGNVGNFTVKLYSDSGSNTPGADLGVVFSGNGAPGTGQFTYTASNPFTLAAGTNYWIVASDSGTYADGEYVNYSFGLTDNPAETGDGITSGWSIADGYRMEASYGTVQSTTEAMRFALDVSTTAAPEPGRGLLLLLGSLGVVLRRRRR